MLEEEACNLSSVICLLTPDTRHLKPKIKRCLANYLRDMTLVIYRVISIQIEVGHYSSMIATGRAQPALAPLILTGKQHTVNPDDLPMAAKLASFSI